jgi:Concanavalin A-like lectin/glucanases superfamily
MSYSAVVLADSPIRYHRLGESSGASAIDAGSQLQNGTITSVSYGTAGLLVADSDTAMTFNGTSSYITLPATGLPTGAASWTMECWITTPNPLPTSLGTVMMMMGHETTGNGATLFLDAASGGKITVDAWSSTAVAWSTLPGVSTTYHVVATYDGTTLSLYVNGSLVNSATASFSLTYPDGAGGAIGATSGVTQDSRYAGVIDEVAIYSTALSATQVAAHYTAGTIGGIGGDPTVYGSAVADATLTTACDMANTTGGIEVAKTTTVNGGAGNDAEIWSKGTASSNAVSGIPTAPTGHGWIFYPGAGTFVLGNWSGIVALSTAVAVNPAVFTLRFFRLPAGVLANAVSIGSIPLSTSTAIATRTVYTFGATSEASFTTAANDGIYFDLWLNDSFGVFGDNPTVYLSTTSAVGVANDMQVTTANFVPASTAPYVPHQTLYTGRGIDSTIITQTALWYIGRGLNATLVTKYIARGLASTLITPITRAALSDTLAGVGTLSGSLAIIAWHMTDTLAGVGTLTGTAQLSTSLTSTLAGVGTLTGTLSLSTSLTNTLAGVGTLSETLSANTALAATFAGVGTLSGTAQLATALASTLTGVGTLNGTLSASGNVALTCTFAGVGTLSGTSALSTALTDTLAGVGTLAGTASLATALTDTLVGVGTLAGTTSLKTVLAITLVGVGTLSGTLSTTGGVSLSVTMVGVGTLAGTLTEKTALTTTLAGVGTLAGTLSANLTLPSVTLVGVGTLAGVASLSTALGCQLSGVGALSGVFSIRVALFLTCAGMGTLSGTLAVVGHPSHAQIMLQAARGTMMLHAARGKITVQAPRGTITLHASRGKTTLQSPRGTITLKGD